MGRERQTYPTQNIGGYANAKIWLLEISLLQNERTWETQCLEREMVARTLGLNSFDFAYLSCLPLCLFFIHQLDKDQKKKSEISGWVGREKTRYLWPCFTAHETSPFQAWTRVLNPGHYAW